MITKRVFLGLCFVSVVLLPFTQGLTQTQPTPGAKAPIITQSYAVEKGRYGDVVKFFIEATDPDADMFRIAAVVDQVGYGRHPTSWIYLKPQHKDHFVGYVEWSTYSSKSIRIRDWTQLTIRISVFDSRGKESPVATFPFVFMSEALFHPPPPAPFDQANVQRLGMMDVDLVEPSAPLFPD